MSSSLEFFWMDKNEESGIGGTPLDAETMGFVHPEVNSVHRQLIVPHGSRGFILRGGTFFRLLLPQSEDMPKALVAGVRKDHVVESMVDVLDFGKTVRGGKDYRIYLCLARTPDEPAISLKVSLNDDVPVEYDAANSFKIGGFHTLCSGVETIAGHPLSDKKMGDILPASFWDLKHRPVCDPAGMVCVSELNFWSDIYLMGLANATAVSVYNVAKTVNRTYGQFVEDLFKVGKIPLSDEEFSCASEGSNQMTNIANSAEPPRSGGHKDTAGRRMVSNYGLEDCCGAAWQWLRDTSFGSNQSASYTADGQKGGVSQVNGILAGGTWNSGVAAGSRCRLGSVNRVAVSNMYSCRGRADHRC